MKLNPSLASKLLVAPLSVALLVLAGCEASPPTAPAPARPAVLSHEPAPDPVEDLAGFGYTYTEVGKRDPFRSQDRVPSTPPGNLPTQRFDLDQFRLIAVVTGIASPKVMVEDPNGKGHVLERNGLIGKNWGRIRTIHKSGMVVREEHVGLSGARIQQDVEISIPQPPPIETL